MLGSDEQRPPGARIVAGSGGFELHYPATEISQHHRCDRSRECPREIENEYVFERSHIHILIRPG